MSSSLSTSPLQPPQMNLLQSKTNSADLFSDVPIHQLLDVDITKMNNNELDALISHLGQLQHAPAARRSIAKKESNSLKKGTKHETTADAFSHLL